MLVNTVHDLIDRLVTLPGSEQLANPYAPVDDSRAAIRRDNLARYLVDMQQRQPRVLMLAEAPGHRGCALSGIPVTSERIMLRGVAKWGLFGEGYRATSGHPQGVAEMTATILWSALIRYADQPPLIWNALPLHPHLPSRPQSNRTPTAIEQRIGLPFIRAVCDLFSFDLILAVGRKAQGALDMLSLPYVPLRHPSQGGKATFEEGMRGVFRV